MKQRIVIYAPMNDEKSRSKAMTLASKIKGMTKVEVIGDKNLLVVIGEGIDSVELAKSLRKKFCFANIVSIQTKSSSMSRSVAFMDQETRFNEEEEEDMNRPQTMISYDYPTRFYQPSYNYKASPVYNPNPPSICSIM